MAQWDLAIQLDREREETLYLQIASAIQEGIRKGRFRPGDALPALDLDEAEAALKSTPGRVT